MTSTAPSVRTMNQFIHAVLVLTALIATTQLPANAACTPPTGGGVSICSPHTGSNDVNPVHYIAAASSPTCAGGISIMALVSASGATLYSIAGSTIDTFLPQSVGAYTTTVKATDKCGGVKKNTVNLTVIGTAVITYQ